MLMRRRVFLDASEKSPMNILDVIKLAITLLSILVLVTADEIPEISQMDKCKKGECVSFYADTFKLEF